MKEEKHLQKQTQNRKMETKTYILKITLNVNGLNASTKRYSLDRWIQKQDVPTGTLSIYAVYKRWTSNLGTRVD